MPKHTCQKCGHVTETGAPGFFRTLNGVVYYTIAGAVLYAVFVTARTALAAAWG